MTSSKKSKLLNLLNVEILLKRLSKYLPLAARFQLLLPTEFWYGFIIEIINLKFLNNYESFIPLDKKIPEKIPYQNHNLVAKWVYFGHFSSKVHFL